jgi:hypothetical protein
MTNYDYPFSAFLNGVVAPDRLLAEIRATGLSAKIHHIDTRGTTCTIVFTADLTAAEYTTLDGIVAAHTGQPITFVEFRAGSTLVTDAKTIEGAGWVDVGGVVSRISFLTKHMPNAFARVVGQVKCAGDDAEFRVVDSDGTALLGPVTLSDTEGEWAILSLTTAPGLPFDAVETLYVAQAQKNTATELAFRYLSFSLLEVVV